MDRGIAARPRYWAGRLLLHTALIAGALVMIYPLLWMISSSLKPESIIFTDLSIWPRGVTFSNYVEGWTSSIVPFGVYFFNSFIVSAGSIVGNLIACSLAAYAFARIEFRFKWLWFAIMLGTIMLPFHVLVIPQYILFQNLGWLDTYLPLLVPKFIGGEAFFIFLMVQFIRTIPKELDQAAMVDGCGFIGIYWRIILPLLTPAIVTTAIFTFIWTWNDFFSHLIYLNDVTKYTVPLGLRQFFGGLGGESNWGDMFAMTTLSLVPVIVVFVAFQKLLIEGISTSGLKG